MLPCLEGASNLTPLLYLNVYIKNVIKLYSVCLEDHLRENISISSSPMNFFSLKKKRLIATKGKLSIMKVLSCHPPPDAFYHQWMSTRSGLPSYPALVLLPQNPFSLSHQPKSIEIQVLCYYYYYYYYYCTKAPSFHTHPLLDKFGSQ